ncbi:hypothetical protein H0O01_05375 [Candidatus Micrarchaeota archaeon]|nr:hypothetical protein [Candidatus Micrarchaeota archaeon]
MKGPSAPTGRFMIAFGFVLLIFFAGCTSPGGNGGSTHNTTTACTDSDGGRDTGAAGRVSVGSLVRSDSCVGASTVKEYYCEEGILGVSDIPCGSGYVCTNGACTPVPCSDSDNGEVAETKGTATSGATSQTDSCASETSVTEYYCSGGGILSKSISCGTGKHCSDGACVAYTCTDSDGGQEPGEAGTASIGDNRKTDTCSSDNRKMTEYYCDASGNIRNASISCASDETCRDGACVEAACTDSDGGQTKGTAGNTTLGTTSHTDSCYSNTSVLEYYCSASGISETTLTCDSGYYCNAGACARVSCFDNEENLDIDDQYWFAFKTASSLTLYVGEKAQIDGDYYLGLDSVDGTEGDETATLTIYDKDGEVDTCDVDNGEDTSNLCGEGISLEVTDISLDDEYARIRGDLAYLQIYSQDGTVTTYNGPGCMKADEYDIDTETSTFYPKLVSSTVKMLGALYRVSSVENNQSVTIEIDGDAEEIGDGDDVRINGQDYTFSLEFSDYGLVEWTIEKS